MTCTDRGIFEKFRLRIQGFLQTSGFAWPVPVGFAPQSFPLLALPSLAHPFTRTATKPALAIGIGGGPVSLSPPPSVRPSVRPSCLHSAWPCSRGAGGAAVSTPIPLPRPPSPLLSLQTLARARSRCSRSPPPLPCRGIIRQLHIPIGPELPGPPEPSPAVSNRDRSRSVRP